MLVCDNGYELRKDLLPPVDCHLIDKDELNSCKECPYYDHEYDLVERAIESAKCRIYRIKKNTKMSKAHQVKAENQVELMKITIKALEFYRDKGCY